MSTSRDDLYKAALELGEADRAELVGLLLDSLDVEVEEGVEAAWLAEIERRARQLDSGSVEAVPWAEVRTRIFRGLGD